MPLYVYTCDTCEIELEELRASSQADWPVECPVCHDLCNRAMTTFNMGRGSTTRSETRAPSTPSDWGHAAGCGCCAPRRR